MVQILLFELDGERFGVVASAVRELHRAIAVTAIPGGPDAMEGVIDLRGRVIAQFDTRARFGRAARSMAVTDHLIVAQAGAPPAGRPVALRVDRVLELV